MKNVVDPSKSVNCFWHLFRWIQIRQSILAGNKYIFWGLKIRMGFGICSKAHPQQTQGFIF